MSDLLTPISDFLQTQLEASRRITDALFAGTGKLDHAMLDATHRVADEQLRLVQAIGNTRDPQTYSNLQATYWASKPDELQLFQKRMVQIVTEMQNELGRAAQSYMEQMQVRTMRGMPSAPHVTGNPASMSTINPFGSVMSVWETTMRGMSSMADQAISTARSGATRAGREFARTSAQVLSDASRVAENTVPQDDDVSDDAATGTHGSDDTSHDSGDSGRHRNGLGSHGDQRKPGSTRRK